VTDALSSTVLGWEAVDVSGADDAYFGLLAELWSEQQPFIIVEHDVVVNVRAMVSLELCANEWCGCPYRYLGGTIVGLGCTKFAAALMHEIPDLFDLVAHLEDDTHPPRHWCRLDAWVQRAMADLHSDDPTVPIRCIEHPEVDHLVGSHPAHDCRR
jgi:hypothetical protein